MAKGRPLSELRDDITKLRGKTQREMQSSGQVFWEEDDCIFIHKQTNKATVISYFPTPLGGTQRQVLACLGCWIDLISKVPTCTYLYE